DVSQALSVDDSGNSYVVGYFENLIIFGSDTLISLGQEDIFISKLDSQGQFIWSVRGGGVKSDTIHDITVDALGNSYVTGVFGDTVSLGNVTISSLGDKDMFVAKLNAQGQYVWALNGGGIKESAGYGISIDNQSNIIVTGAFSGTITIDNKSLTSSTIREDIFIIKLG